MVKQIRSPDGKVLGAFEYDKKGRATAMIDGEGNRLIYGFDVPNHKQTVTDRNGNATLYEYNMKGNVTKKTDPLGNVNDWTYDDDGNMTSEILTDANGDVLSHKSYEYDGKGNKLFEHVHMADTGEILTTGYTYNNRNQILTMTDPKGIITIYDYDDKGNLTMIAEPGGKTTINQYDADGNLASMQMCGYGPTQYIYYPEGTTKTEIDSLGNLTEYTYYPDGNVETATRHRTTEDGAGNPATRSMMTQYEYDHMGRVTKTIDPLLNEEITEYNDIGKKSATVNKNGVRTEYAYDGAGNLTDVFYADSSNEHYTYDAEGNKLIFTDRDGNITGYGYDALNRLTNTWYCGTAATCTADNAIHESGTIYDGAGRVVAQIEENDAAITGDERRTEYDYDDAGRRTKVRRFLDGRAIETVFAYDANGAQKSVTDANGRVTSYEYDESGRMKKTVFHDGSFVEFEYDCMGRKSVEYAQAMPGQANRVKTRYHYDAQGRLVGVTNDAGGPDEMVMTYGYDEIGNKVSQTDPNGNTKTWVYDDLGRVTKHTLPEGMSEFYAYYPNGNVKTKTDFNGDTITYDYYPCCGRVQSKTYPDGTSISYTYTNTGLVDQITDQRGVTDHDYDFRGRLKSVSNPDGSAISYTYYANGNKKSVTVPSGTTTNYYDDLNRLSKVVGPDSGETVYAYYDNGNRKSVTYPIGTISEYTYDDLNQLTNLTNKKTTGETISSYTYTLDVTGNRLRVDESPNARSLDYDYDRLFRLIGENIHDSVNGDQTISYTYDNFGNRITKTDSTGTIVYAYDDNDRLLSEIGPDGYFVSYAYDDNGNTTQKSQGSETTSYAYDFENRLISVQNPANSLGYEYDAEGVRTASIVDGNITRYLLDKNRDYAQVLEERNSNGNLTVSYLYGDDLISQNRSGNKSFYLYDGQLSTRKLADASGVVTDSYVYDAFGVLLKKDGATVNNYLYGSEQLDPNIGFYYLRARYYEYDIGRFNSSDPWEGNVRDPISMHKYTYANTNPVKYRDPSGFIAMSDLGSIMTGLSIRSVLNSAKLAVISTLFSYLTKKKINWSGTMSIYTWGPGGTDVAGGLVHIKLESEKYKNYKAVGEYTLLLLGFSFEPPMLDWVPNYSHASITVETPGFLGANPYLLIGNCFFGSFSITSSTGLKGEPKLSVTQIYMGTGIAWAEPDTWLADWGFDVGLDIMGGISMPILPTLKRIPLN